MFKLPKETDICLPATRQHTAKLTLMYQLQNSLTHKHIARLCPPKVSSIGYVNLSNKKKPDQILRKNRLLCKICFSFNGKIME